MEYYIVWIILIVACFLEAVSSEIYPPDYKNDDK
jgi:hypothetical protein